LRLQGLISLNNLAERTNINLAIHCTKDRPIRPIAGPLNRKKSGEHCGDLGMRCGRQNEKRFYH